MANRTLTRLLFPILLLAGAPTSATATEGKRVVPQALDQRRAALQIGRVMFDQRQLDRLGQRADDLGVRMSSLALAWLLHVPEIGSMRSAQAIYVARPAPRGRRPDGVGGT